MASIEQDVTDYEQWLRAQCNVVEADLDAKHRRMRKSEFDFLRATYFRWARTIEALCPLLAEAPRVLGIGDIHIENYGTWRDAEARLVWGINDFDEAAVMPYPFDLVRLATSAVLAPDLDIPLADVVTSILSGYSKGLSNPQAMLPDEDAGWLRPYVNPTAKTNDEFWKEVGAYPDAEPPDEVERVLTDALPGDAKVQRFASRRNGGGSLGRPRFLVIASWNSGRIVREAKALVPSAWTWAHGSSQENQFLQAAFGIHRSPDPHLRCDAGYVVRRVAPDSRKIDVDELEANGLIEELLEGMAADLAAVHAASRNPGDIAEDLDGRPKRWLRDAVKVARDATKRDFAKYDDQ